MPSWYWKTRTTNWLVRDNTFIFLLVLYLFFVVGAAIYLVYLFRQRGKNRITDLRNDWTNKLHQDIGGDISSVHLRLDTLQRKLAKSAPEFQQEAIICRELLTTIRQKFTYVFDLIDERMSSLQVMLADVTDYAQSNFSATGIAFNYTNELPEQLPDIDIVRINKLYLAIKEAYNNCLKHAHSTKVEAVIQLLPNVLQIRIADNGKGFDTTQVHPGSGLKNLKQYTEEGSLQINISSAIGNGTCVNISVPLR